MVGFFGLSEIHFAARRADGQGNTVISPGSVTILVGPNNSGKSTALREIHQLYLDLPTRTERPQVVRQIVVPEPTNWTDLLGSISPWEITPVHIPYGRDAGMTPVIHDDTVLQYGLSGGHTVRIAKIALLSHDNFQAGLRSLSLRPFMILTLGGRDRLRLTDPVQIQGGSDQQDSLQAKMYHNVALKKRISQIVLNAFGFHLEVDATNHAEYVFRISREALPVELEQKSNREAEVALGSMPLLHESGDGIQSFIGLVASTKALPYKLVLIDEPEAFLHPPLARRLGRE